MKLKRPIHMKFWGIEIHINTREFSIKFGRRKITIKSEKADPNEETQKRIERKDHDK